MFYVDKSRNNLNKYVYKIKNVLQLFGASRKPLSMLCVFLLSAVVHEYILTVTLGFFYPVLFLLFQGAGCKLLLHIFCKSLFILINCIVSLLALCVIIYGLPLTLNRRCGIWNHCNVTTHDTNTCLLFTRTQPLISISPNHVGTNNTHIHTVITAHPYTRVLLCII